MQLLVRVLTNMAFGVALPLAIFFAHISYKLATLLDL